MLISPDLRKELSGNVVIVLVNTKTAGEESYSFDVSILYVTSSEQCIEHLQSV